MSTPEEELKNRLKGNAVILGIGNTLRSDDGAGALLARRLEHNVSFTVIDAGSCLENYPGKVIALEPETIVIVDAADFGASAGEIKIITEESLGGFPMFFTHNAPLSMVINFLKNALAADIMILIIQPKSISFGETLSNEVAKALDKIEQWFYEADKKTG